MKNISNILSTKITKMMIKVVEKGYKTHHESIDDEQRKKMKKGRKINDNDEDRKVNEDYESGRDNDSHHDNDSDDEYDKDDDNNNINIKSGNSNSSSTSLYSSSSSSSSSISSSLINNLHQIFNRQFTSISYYIKALITSKYLCSCSLSPSSSLSSSTPSIEQVCSLFGGKVYCPFHSSLSMSSSSPYHDNDDDGHNIHIRFSLLEKCMSVEIGPYIQKLYINNMTAAIEKIHKKLSE